MEKEYLCSQDQPGDNIQIGETSNPNTCSTFHADKS